MSLKATYALRLSVVETFTNALLAAADKSLTTSGLSIGDTLTSSSNVPATVQAAGTKAMSAGAGTIDLRAVTDAPTGRVQDGNGLKVQFAILTNPATNANAITIVGGASNGYLLFGAAGSAVLQPGESIAVFGADAKPDIDATHKTLDISGTGSQPLSYHILMG